MDGVAGDRLAAVVADQVDLEPLAAGVSAGIDMALHLVERLAGEQVARTVQLLIEYDPQPPLGGIDWRSADLDF